MDPDEFISGANFQESPNNQQQLEEANRRLKEQLEEANRRLKEQLEEASRRINQPERLLELAYELGKANQHIEQLEDQVCRLTAENDRLSRHNAIIEDELSIRRLSFSNNRSRSTSRSGSSRRSSRSPRSSRRSCFRSWNRSRRRDRS